MNAEEHDSMEAEVTNLGSAVRALTAQEIQELTYEHWIIERLGRAWEDGKYLCRIKGSNLQ